MKRSLQNWLDNLEDTLFDDAIVRLHQALEVFHAARNYNDNSQHEAACIYFKHTLTGLINYLAYQKSPLLVFRDLPIEWRLSMLQADMNIHMYISREEELKMQANYYPFITFEEGIRLFEHIHPTKKHELKPYWLLLNTYRTEKKKERNTDEIAFISDKLGFLTLDLLTHLIEEGVFPPKSYNLTDEDRQFLQVDFPEKRVKRVEQALQYPEQYPVPIPEWPENTWNSLAYNCPSCHHQAIMYGFTELEVEGKQDILSFYACLLACEYCQLKLWDSSELLIAGCANVFDITHQLDQWLNDRELFVPEDKTMPAK